MIWYDFTNLILGLWGEVNISKPSVSFYDYHSLAEITAENNGQIVEIGWTVAIPFLDPQIFVFHWINGQPTCYNSM